MINLNAITISAIGTFDKIKEQLGEITGFIKLLLSPKDLFLHFWDNLFLYSYIVCLFILIAGILINMMGSKNKLGSKLVKGSFITYILANILNLAIH